ncbi:hypothetical protein Tco_0765516 [Tanacetum coccineum]
MNTELVKSSETRTEGSSKRAGDELESDNSKKQKIDEHVEAEKKMITDVGIEEKSILNSLKLMRPEDEYERVLWGDMKVMFEPDIKSEYRRKSNRDQQQVIPVPAWPYDGTPDDILGADEISMNNSQPIGSQEPTDEVPAPAPIIRRESERLKLINFNKPLSPGLTKDDAMLAD